MIKRNIDAILLLALWIITINSLFRVIFSGGILDFQNYIAKKYKGKSISMWKLSVDNMSGAFYWSKSGSNVEVLATPFCDGEEKLPVDIQDTDSGDYISQKSFPLKFTGDMKKDEEAYFKILKLVLSKVK